MKRLALLLFVVGLILAAALFARTLQVVPMTITANDHDAQVRFTADDTSVFFPSDCIHVSWSVDNIRAVKLDDDAVIGQGDDVSCALTPSLKVTFQDGSKETYAIPKQVRIESLPTRILLVLDLLALGVALSIAASVLWAKLARSAAGQRLDGWLPKLARSDRALGRTSLLMMAVLLILVGAAVRAYFLSRPLDHDESWTYNDFASQSLSIIVTFYQSTNNHILHTLLAHESTSIFGLHPWALRLPAYFAGLLTIAATFAVGRRFYNASVGLLAAGLVAGASWLIEYSTDARGYSMIALDFLLLLLVASRLRRGGNARTWVIFAVLSALGLFTIPIMIYPLGIVCMWLGLSILQANQGRSLWLALRNMLLSLLLAGLLTGLLYLPALLYVTAMPTEALDVSSSQTIDFVGWVQAYTAVAGRVWADATRDLPVWFIVVLVVGLVVSLLMHARLSRFRISLVGAALLWLPIFVFLYMTFTYDRLWLFLLPICLTAAASGLVYLGRGVFERFPPAVFRLGLVIPVLVALAAGTGAIRSNALVLRDDLGRALGAEEGIQWLRGHLGTSEVAYCAGHCSESETYGRMYDVRFITIGSQPDMPDKPFYLLAVQAKQSNNVDSILGYVDQSSDDYVSVSRVFENQDARIYYLVPKP